MSERLTAAELAAREEAIKREKGRQTEERFDQAMRSIGHRAPAWFYGIRAASRQEDNSGTDRYAILDIGEVPLQIKSSAGGRAAYRMKRPTSPCLILVILSEFTPRQIQIVTIRELRRHREALTLPAWKQRILYPSKE